LVQPALAIWPRRHFLAPVDRLKFASETVGALVGFVRYEAVDRRELGRDPIRAPFATPEPFASHRTLSFACRPRTALAGSVLAVGFGLRAPNGAPGGPALVIRADLRLVQVFALVVIYDDRRHADHGRTRAVVDLASLPDRQAPVLEP
jgi:hypothetical protein